MLCRTRLQKFNCAYLFEAKRISRRQLLRLPNFLKTYAFYFLDLSHEKKMNDIL